MVRERGRGRERDRKGMRGGGEHLLYLLSSFSLSYPPFFRTTGDNWTFIDAALHNVIPSLIPSHSYLLPLFILTIFIFISFKAPFLKDELWKYSTTSGNWTFVGDQDTKGIWPRDSVMNSVTWTDDQYIWKFGGNTEQLNCMYLPPPFFGFL